MCDTIYLWLHSVLKLMLADGFVCQMSAIPCIPGTRTASYQELAIETGWI